jgi:hypothetical protein
MGTKYVRTNYQGGGVCIFIRSDMYFTPINLSQFCEEKNIEICSLKISLVKSNILIICIYRSPSGNFEHFINKLDKALNLLSKPKNEFVLCGDFNINFLEESSRKSQLLALLQSYNLFHTVLFPTRVTVTNSSSIDNIFIDTTRSNSYEITSVRNGLSDHDAQCLFLKNINSLNKKAQVTTRRLINKVSVTQFLNKLSNEVWDNIYSLHDVNEIFNAFLNRFLLTYESFFTKHNSTNNYKDNGWLTTGIRISCRRKESLFILYRTNSNYLFKSYYKTYSMILRRVIREAKRKYYNQLISIANNKTKTTWNIIKSESGKSNNLNKERLPQIFLNNNKKINTKEAAHNFNKFFSSVSDNLNIKKTNVFTAMSHLYSHSQNGFPAMNFNVVTPDEIINIISKFKSKNSSGYDGVSNKIIKLCKQQISEPLAYIINKSLTMGIYPERLKYSVVKPVFKKGDKADISNYRPISVVTGFAKIFETVIFKRLNEHILKYKILRPEQFGFRKGLSTEDAMFKLTNTILTAWNKKEYVVGIFCDISKAFDCVSHDLLLMKLQYYGVQGILLQWFKSYLHYRKQRVELNYATNKYYSNWETVKTGVPQGSVLGPLLFNIFINDFPLELGKTAEVVMFADDTSILCAAKDSYNLNIKLDVVFKYLSTWFQNNQLMINLNKTQIVKFTPIQTTSYSLHTLYFNDRLNEAELIKFLGLQLDNHLTCREHIESLTHKLSSVCFQIRKLSNILNLENLKVIYYAYYHSLVKYGIIFWGNTSDSHKVFVIQKRLIRIMMGVDSTHTCRDLFRKLEILPLPCVYLFSLMTFVAGNLDKFQTNYAVYTTGTRRNDHLHLPFARLSSYQRGVYYSGIKLFNTLPLYITVLKNDKKQFRQALRSYLQSNVFYSVNEFVDHAKGLNVNKS